MKQFLKYLKLLKIYFLTWWLIIREIRSSYYSGRGGTKTI